MRNNLPKNFLNFIKYNNAVPFIIAILFVGGTSAFAASPDLRQEALASVVSSQTTITSVDNSRILSIDFDTFNFAPQVLAITEDNDSYFITYSYATVDIKDFVWKDVRENNTITVPKSLLGKKDLGLYVASQIKEVVDSKITYLKRVQSDEKKKGESKKVAAVTYSGLIGKFLNSKEEVFEGYTPVIPEPTPSQAQPGVIVPVQAENISNTTQTNSDTLRALVEQIVKDTLGSGSIKTDTTSSVPATTSPQTEQASSTPTTPEVIITPSPEPEPTPASTDNQSSTQSEEVPTIITP
jgi:hypothetical protein